MRLKVKSLLYDAQQAIELADRFTLHQSFETYAGDPMRRAAVERQLAIIGEALNQLIRLDPASAARISEHRRLMGLRNILVDSYAKVDDRVIWSIVQDKLPGLRHEVEDLLVGS
jgi:uncharacterized protein with HEPN domain